MGLGDEVKGDFLKMLGMIGVFVGFIVLFTLFSISIWLVVALLVIVTAGFLFYQRVRGGSR